MNNNTIEPRLIALLNDVPSESYTTSPSLELPPLQDPNILKASGRPLLLEPDASKRNGKPASNTQLAPKRNPLIVPIDEAEAEHKSSEPDQKSAKGSAERALGASSPQSLRKILDNDTESTGSIPSKKRHIVDTSKDDFVQLPQPPKKQKATKQVVPPIIIGLFEPPPQATLFPPIASSSFHDSHGRNTLNTVPSNITDLKDPPKNDSSNDAEQNKPGANKLQKKREVRARKKWTENETNNLLLGVHKHGVGNWTDILEDSSFSFNDRSALDLKDRFRTCCPNELRGKSSNSGISPKGSAVTTDNAKIRTNTKSNLMSENILIEDDEIEAGGVAALDKQQKSRAHRKRLEDLAQLGIEGPFPKSKRRERRPFSEDEDRAILSGYELYGPAWTRIQRDTSLNLQSRQPTDLRDRFRNKHPEKFMGEGKGSKKASKTAKPPSDYQVEGRNSSIPTLNQSSSFQSYSHETEGRGSDPSGKESSSGINTPAPFQPLSNRDGLRIQEIISPVGDISKSRPLEAPSSLFSFKDNDNAFAEQPGMESSDGLPFTQSFDWNSGITAPFSSNEMDISRLLLDENWPDIPNSNSKEKQSFNDKSSMITSTTEPLHNGPSFLNMLNDPDPMDDMTEVPFE